MFCGFGQDVGLQECEIISDGTFVVLRQLPLLTQLVVNGEEAMRDGIESVEGGDSG